MTPCVYTDFPAHEYLVYCLRNTQNGMLYFGQTCKPLRDRWSKHVTDSRRPSRSYRSTFSQAIREFGEAAFVGDVIVRGLSKADADFYEAAMIAGYPAQRLYNETAGGAYGERSPRARQRMSESCRPPQTPEAQAKREASLRKNGATPEFKAKMSAVNKANWAKRRAQGGDTGQAAATARRSPEQRALTGAQMKLNWQQPELRAAYLNGAPRVRRRSVA